MPRARVIEVIQCDLTVSGEGTNRDPSRPVFEYYDRDGRLLADYDPYVGRSFEAARKLLKANLACAKLRGVCGSNRNACRLVVKTLQNKAARPQARIAEALELLEAMAESLDEHAEGE